MNIQYITDDSGKSTGVFIPISEWNVLKARFKDLENDISIPDAHKQILDSRITFYQSDPSIALDFNNAIKSLEE